MPEFFECRVKPQTIASSNATRLQCVATAFGRSSGYSLGYKYANQALFTFIPLVLLAVFNSLLIHAVLTAARRRQVMAKTGSQCITATRPSASAATSSAAAAATLSAVGDVSSGHERQRRGQQRITVSVSAFVIRRNASDNSDRVGQTQGEYTISAVNVGDAHWARAAASALGDMIVVTNANKAFLFFTKRVFDVFKDFPNVFFK